MITCVCYTEAQNYEETMKELSKGKQINIFTG